MSTLRERKAFGGERMANNYEGEVFVFPVSPYFRCVHFASKIPLTGQHGTRRLAGVSEMSGAHRWSIGPA